MSRNKVDIEAIRSLYTIFYSIIYKAASTGDLANYEFRIGYEELLSGQKLKDEFKGSCLSIKLDLDWDDDGLDEEDDYE